MGVYCKENGVSGWVGVVKRTVLVCGCVLQRERNQWVSVYCKRTGSVGVYCRENGISMWVCIVKRTGSVGVYRKENGISMWVCIAERTGLVCEFVL